jgi:hypothetical protein
MQVIHGAAGCCHSLSADEQLMGLVFGCHSKFPPSATAAACVLAVAVQLELTVVTTRSALRAVNSSRHMMFAAFLQVHGSYNSCAAFVRTLLFRS